MEGVREGSGEVGSEGGIVEMGGGVMRRGWEKMGEGWRDGREEGGFKEEMERLIREGGEDG